MQADYSRSVVDTYTEVTTEYIRATNSLWPLTVSPMRGTYDQELPSWVIDWTVFRGIDTRNDFRHTHTQVTKLYRSSGDWRGQLSIPDNRYVKTHAIYVGAISNVGETMCTQFGKLAKYWRKLKGVAYSSGVPEDYATGEEWYAALMQVMCGGLSMQTGICRRCTKEKIADDLPGFRTLFQSEQEQENLPKPTNRSVIIDTWITMALNWIDAGFS